MQKEKLKHTVLILMLAIGFLGLIHTTPETALAQTNTELEYPECWSQVEDLPLYYRSEQLPTGLNLQLLADTYRFASDIIPSDIDELPGLPALLIYADKISDVEEFFPQLQDHDVSDDKTRGWRAVVALDPQNKCELSAVTPKTSSELIRDGIVYLNVNNTAHPSATFEELVIMINAEATHETLHTLGTTDDIENSDITSAHFWERVFLSAVLNDCGMDFPNSLDQELCENFRTEVLIPNDFTIGRSEHDE